MFVYPSAMVHAYNPSYLEGWGQEDPKFKAILNTLARPCLKIKGAKAVVQ